MQKTRNRRVEDPDFIAWQKEYQQEQDAAKAVADEAQAALDAADPVKAFQQASNVEAEAVRETILTGYISDSILPGVERMNGRTIANEQAAVNNWKYFAESTASFHYYMADALLSAAERSDLAPIAPNYLALHNLLLAYGAYPEAPAQPAVEQPVAVAEEVVFVDQNGYEWTQSAINALSASDRAGVNHQIYAEKILGHSEDGKAWTMQMIDRLPSNEMRSLLLLFEQGHRSRAYKYFEVKDAQAARDVEIAARRAAEEQQ